MYQGLPQGKDLLGTDDVAAYLGVGSVTVWRWCRDGSLPCLKIGREWRIRREALESFLQRSERSQTLVGRLRAFLEVPDNVLAITQDREMMHRLDAAFFQVGEAQGGRLIKYVGGESWDSLDDARTDLEVALKHQEALQEVVKAGELVAKTAVLEEVVDEWPGKMLRRAQVLHSGTIWFSEYGLALSRVTPPPSS